MEKSGAMATQANQIEVDFEAQNWNKARQDFLSRRKDPNSDNVRKFLADRIDGPGVKEIVQSTQVKADKKYSPGLGGILSKIDILMKVGDLAIKSAPESVGLAWMGVRLCLHSIEDDFATFQLFSSACADIVGIMISCRVFGKMYGTENNDVEGFQELHSKVVEYIPGIYADILDFSYLVKKHMSQRTGFRIVKGMFSSAKANFEPKITGIKVGEQNMNKYATTASQRLTIHYEKVGLAKQDQSIGYQESMMSDLSFIKESLDASTKASEIFMKHIQLLEEEKKGMKKKTPFDKAKDLFDDNSKKLNPSTHSENALRKNIQRREEGTCRWIYDLTEYKDWYNSPKSGMIWISGAGGYGKSILTSSIVQEYQETFEGKEDSTVQYFFCANGDDSTQSADRIKKHLLQRLYALAVSEESLELFEKANDLISDFVKESDAKQKKSDKSITFEDAYTGLARTLNRKVFLVIDALDEIGDRKDSRFLGSLQKMLEVPDVQLKILIGSRPNADIEEELSGVTQIKIEEWNGPDIERNVRHELGKLPSLSHSEQEQACSAIVKKARGLFRCVEPAIDFLKKPFQRPLSRRLEALPDGLNNSYLQILHQTDPDYLPLLETSLTWAIFTQLKKPTVAEVMDTYSRAYADGMEGDENHNPYDDSGDTLSSEQIRTAGGGTFIEIAANEISVRHTTVSDFFLKSEETELETNGQGNGHANESCASCRIKSPQQPFQLSAKAGHLRMVLIMFEHLNSPLFQKRYLKNEVKEETSGGEDAAKEEPTTTETNDRDHSNEKNGVLGQDEDLNIALNNKDPDSPEMNRDLPNGILGGKGIELHEDGSTPNVAGEEGAINGVGAPTGEEGAKEDQQPDGDASGHAEIPANEEKEGVTEGAAEAAADQPEYDPFADDDDDPEIATQPSEAGPEPELELIRERYEISHWYYHFQMAEKLWPRAEREGNEEWDRLWDLAEQFMCKNPAAFQAWQRQYSDLVDSMFWVYEGHYLSPLHVAAVFGLTGLAEILIKCGESASAAMEDGRQPLYYAAGKDYELLKLLLENGGDPNSRGEFEPPFHRQLGTNPRFEDVKLFLEHGADCGIKDPWDFNAMHWFSFSGTDVSVLELLLESKADINIVDDIGETPLHKLVSRRDIPLDLLRSYIKHGAGVNLDDADSQRPLYEVSMEGNVEAVKILLENDADIEDDDKRGNTALHIAAYYGHLETVKLLAEKGPGILNKRDKVGRTPFFFAAQNGHIETARFLLKYSLEHGDEEVLKGQNDGRTSLSKATGRGHVEIVKLLLEESPNTRSTINTPETDAKRTPLHRAAYNGRGDAVDLLLENGADATIADSNGKTPLALCNLGWSKGKKSADWESILIKLISRDQETAANDPDLLFTAALKGSPHVVEKLLQSKADANRQDQHGWTAVQLARQMGKTDVATILSKRGAVGARPSRWVTEWERVKLSEDGIDLELTGNGEDTSVLANHPIPAGIERFYYEVEIRDDVGELKNPFIAIGYATQPARVDRMPGWYNAAAPSWAYHGDDGRLFANANQSVTEYGDGPYGQGDTIGCGVIFGDGVNGTIFYTRNGKCTGVAFENSVRGRLFPVHGIATKAATKVNFGNDLDSKPFKWAPAVKGNFDLALVKSEGKSEG